MIETARRMNALGINRGKSGNVSARINRGFLVTPSALDYDKTRPEDIVAIDNADNTIGRRSPSSEWRFHRDIYAARTDVEAIVHAHAPFATTIACLDRGIPPFHYMVAAAGGRDIRCAPYATFGTQALSDAAVRALEDRRACLLAHHGMIAVGASLDAALALSVEVEALAQMYWQALAVGEPRLLDEREMREVVERFADYRPHIAHAGRR
ncbi:MAG TPA: class II aldolase/adducin family protein [Casimicrobiaceae bacterium]|nr:class II aldolase/adducin family protein [Casimicrobiaceae bacterium]